MKLNVLTIYSLLFVQKLQSMNDELNKSCSVGSSDENAIKNRSDCVIPFDRNRVRYSLLLHSLILQTLLNILYVLLNI